MDDKEYLFDIYDIPYQELYDDNVTQNDDDKIYDKISFTQYINTYFNSIDGVDILTDISSDTNTTEDLNIDQIRQIVAPICEKQSDWDNKPYIFDGKILRQSQVSQGSQVSQYWSGHSGVMLQQRFNTTQLIPDYLKNIFEDRLHELGFNSLKSVESYFVVLKQFAVGSAGTGAQPHWHGPALNGLIYGKKLWMLIPPSFSFQMKCTAMQFFCNSDMLNKLVIETNIPFRSFIQNVGDVVFVPHQWTHVVFNLQPSIAIAMEIIH